MSDRTEKAATEVQADCDRIVRAALAEPDPREQVVMLLRWLIEMGKSGAIEIVPPLDAMLGLTPPAKAEGSDV